MDKKAAWNFALGLIKVDGLEPTSDFMEMVKKETDGKMTLIDIEQSLNRKYKMKGDTVLGKAG